MTWPGRACRSALRWVVLNMRSLQQANAKGPGRLHPPPAPFLASRSPSRPFVLQLAGRDQGREAVRVLAVPVPHEAPAFAGALIVVDVDGVLALRVQADLLDQEAAAEVRGQDGQE